MEWLAWTMFTVALMALAFFVGTWVGENSKEE